MSKENFRLDTKSMAEAAHNCEKLAKKMNGMYHTIESEKNKVLVHWLGEGSNEFQIKYHQISQQMRDLSINLLEVADAIKTAETSYIEADMKVAKSIEGKTKPEDMLS